MADTNKVQETMAMDLGDLLDLCDGAIVTLVAGETRLLVHRAVLAARSPVFTAMFRHDCLEARNGQVIVPDVEGPVLRQLLAYLYSLRAPQLPAMAPQLLAAANKYGMSDLVAACELQLAAQLSVDNAAATAILAVRHSCDSLRETAIAFIKQHNLKVMATQGWADAILTQPEDVVEVSRLIGDSPTESSAADSRSASSASPRCWTHSGLCQTPTAAALPSAAHHTPPPDDKDVSRMRNLSENEKTSRLLAAAIEGDVQKLRVLLAAGADVGAVLMSEITALHIAAWRGNLEAVRCLVGGGADVGARDNHQCTPLHLAATCDSPAVVRLLAALSDPDARDEMRKTPLHWAAYYGREQVAAALLEAGASWEARDIGGKTPLDIAMQRLLGIICRSLSQNG